MADAEGTTVSEEKETTAAEELAELAVVPAPELLPIEEHPAWPMLSRIPVMMAVGIPMRGFRVCDLLALECGQTVESQWVSTEEVPLKVGTLQLSWGEFEVVDEYMALRLTRLV